MVATFWEENKLRDSTFKSNISIPIPQVVLLWLKPENLSEKEKQRRKEEGRRSRQEEERWRRRDGDCRRGPQAAPVTIEL